LLLFYPDKGGGIWRNFGASPTVQLANDGKLQPFDKANC
jgi:hypothetical protein